VYDKDGVILVNKPRGLLTQGNPDSLELRVQGEFPTAMPANRIDRNTGGIVIFCRDGKTLARIGEEIKDHRIKKSYLLLLQNNPEQPTQQLEQAHIWKDERQAKSYVYPTEKKGTKPIGMYWRTLGKLGEKSEYTLAEAELLTGRTHQIRAHFAYLGYPLVGEGKYAKLKAKSVGQALLSYKTVLADNTEVALDGERITEFFTAYTNGRIDPETITAMLGG
jgi:23S rRNA pseudouridine955/2504/2580 synthase